MQSDNAAVYWLILATSISSVTTAILYLFQRSCGEFWGNISRVCFQNFCASCDLREETFHQVTNLLVFPRILQQLQLHSFKAIWNHDANAQTRDCVQWGWIRLPTKSYVLAFLSVCGVTHYVWIPSDLTSVTMVAPAAAIATLINLSNLAATTPLTETQLDTLRDAFGMGGACTKADEVCTLWERRFLFWILSVCYIGLATMLEPGPARLTAAAVGLVAAVAAYAWQCWRTCRALPHLPWRIAEHCRAFPSIACQCWRTCREPAGIASWRRLFDSSMGVALCTEMAMTGGPSMQSTAGDDLEASGVEPPEGPNETSNTIYSVLVARSYYYEVVKQIEVIPNREVIVRFQEEAQLYAVRLRPNFVHYLAERTELQDNASLHICAHNPMVDPYLTELYQNFQKGVDRENLLMVIFPPLDRLNSCLESPLLGRARTSTCTQFVATLSDLEMLLLQMTAGFIPKLVFVLPIHERTNGGHTETRLAVWLSFQRVLGHENCHWPGQGIP